MIHLEDLKSGARIMGILPQVAVTVVDVHWIGSTAVELTYKEPNGQVANQLLYRDSQPALVLVAAGVAWAFDSDGALFRLVSEAHRIRLAYLFDPLLAVSTSLVVQLPHQITVVYEQMLPRQPLRYLLADDPGCGQDHYDRTAHERVARPGRSAAMPGGLSGDASGTVAGRTF